MPKLKQNKKPKILIAICTGTAAFKGCGKERPLKHKAKRLCLYCNIKRLRQLSLARQKKRGKWVDQTELNKFYKTFWDSQPVKQCFETGEPLYAFRSWFCHHILEKRLYPEHTFNAEVMVLLSLQQHRAWHDYNEQDKATYFPKTYQRLQELKLKYNIT